MCIQPTCSQCTFNRRGKDDRFSFSWESCPFFLSLSTPLSLSLLFQFVVVAIRMFSQSCWCLSVSPFSFLFYAICVIRHFSILYFPCLVCLILVACELSVSNTIPPFPLALAVTVVLLPPLPLLICLLYSSPYPSQF